MALRQRVGEDAIAWCVEKIDAKFSGLPREKKTVMLANFIDSVYREKTGESADKFIVFFLARFYALKAWK